MGTSTPLPVPSVPTHLSTHCQRPSRITGTKFETSGKVSARFWYRAAVRLGRWPGTGAEVSPGDLENYSIPHLLEGRLVIRVLDTEVLTADLLEAVDNDRGVAYRSVHGDVVTASEDVYRLLDTFLEKRLPGAFPMVPARKHWEELDMHLPAGAGPYGSGFRALGSDDNRLDLATVDRLWTDDGILSADGLRDVHGIDINHLEDEDEEGEDDGGWEDLGAPEPWQEVVGDGYQLRRWLLRCLAHKDLNDLDLPWRSDDPAEYEAGKLAARTAQEGLADLLLSAFPPTRARYFQGAHAGWDQHREDYLARDTVVALVDQQRIVIMWMHFSRHYG